MLNVRTDTATASTLNERLNRTLNSINHQCERIEAVLGRVNGTPQRLQDAKAGSAPTPSMSMQNAVESLEAATERLASLAGTVENIA